MCRLSLVSADDIWLDPDKSQHSGEVPSTNYGLNGINQSFIYILTWASWRRVLNLDFFLGGKPESNLLDGCTAGSPVSK